MKKMLHTATSLVITALVLTLCILLLPNSAKADTYGYLTYTVIDEEVTITDCDASAAGAMVIPDTIGGYPVVAIDANAFEGNSITSVTMPDTVKKIGSYAFSGCSKLSSVQLSKGVEVIEGFAFYNCDAITSIEIPKSLDYTTDCYHHDDGWAHRYGVFYDCDNLKTVTFQQGTTQIAQGLFGKCLGLESIVIPNSVTVVEEQAFNCCLNLKNVIFSNSLTMIEASAFEGCNSLTAIQIPDTVTQIGHHAFASCEKLADVKLSKGVEVIEGFAFYNCDAITSIEIPKSLDYTTDCYHHDDGWAHRYGVFYDCDNLKTVTFQQGTTQIANGLFAKCLGLESIVIPNSVTVVEEQAFYRCLNLKSVTFSGSLVTIEGSAFESCESLTAIQIPDTVTKIGHHAFASCEKLADVKLSKGIEVIEGFAFYDCDAITGIEIPKSLDYTTDCYHHDDGWAHRYGVFYDCDNLKTVTFQQGTTQVAKGLFAKCLGLESIVIPNTVTVIEESAFYQCANLKSVDIPNSVTKIDIRAFEQTGLTEVVIPESVTSISTVVFYKCTSLQEVTWPGSLPTIPESTFYGCTALQTVNLPQELTVIGKNAFYDCDGLESITIPERVSTLGDSVFYDCDLLAEITIPSSVTSIGHNAFYDCDALVSVQMGDGVTWLGNNMFRHCDVLKNVTLSRMLTSIPEATFRECAELEQIVIPYYVKTIGNNAFNASPKLKKVYLPDSLTSIADNAFSYANVTVMYGASGSYAQTWAAENGFAFEVNERPATQVSLDTTALTMNKGASYQLMLDIDPENTNQSVSWKSGDTSVVTVSETGMLKAVNVGTATIKVVVGSCSASCRVTVIQPVTYINLNKTSLSLEALQTYQLKANPGPSNAQDLSVSWTSSDPEIASVDETGFVTALKKGTATITVTANDGNGAAKTCTVNVTNTAYVCTEVAQLESSHPYPNNCTDVWSYTGQDAVGLILTFDEQTMIEDGFDYLYIRDGQGNQVGKYTGDDLSGAVIRVDGDTVRLQMDSDDSGAEWGFKVFAIEEVSHTHTYTNYVSDGNATCTEDGTQTAKCDYCEETHTQTQLNSALGHSFGKWTVTKAATATAQGSKRRDCTRCDAYETAVIPKLPVIKTQPVNKYLPAGKTAKFTVKATGTGLKYQWQYRTSSKGSWKTASGTGSKTASLSVAATAARNGYQYRCKVTDQEGSVVYSKAATLKIVTLKVTAQPANKYLPAGKTAKFTVKVSGTGLKYQWQYRTSAKGSWKNASATGSKTATVSVPATATRNGYQYRCKITDKYGNVIYSNAATLKIVTLKVTTQPSSVTLAKGKTATFKVVAKGTGLKYQWQYRKNAKGAWKKATNTGNKTAALKVPVTAARNGYQYRCVITDKYGNVINSAAATLKVKK